MNLLATLEKTFGRLIVEKSAAAESHLALYREGIGWDADGEEPARIREKLVRAHAALPKEYQVTYVDRFDYRTWVVPKEDS